MTARNSAAAVAAAGTEPISGPDGGSALASVAVMERAGSGDSAGLAGGAAAAGAAAGGGYGAQTMVMLERLQALPWRRVDVSFRGTSMPFFAHNLIQARLTWLTALPG